MCELLHTSYHHCFDGNNKGPLYLCRASPFGRHARAGFSLRRLTRGSSLGRGYGTISCVAGCFIGEGGRIPQDVGPLSDPRFIRTETIMSDVEHIYSIADSHTQTVQVCIDRLHELGANEQLKQLTGRLQKLAARATAGVDDRGTKLDQRRARGLRIKRGEQRSGQADRPRGLWAFRAGSSVRNLWRAPCVSLTEPSSRSPQPVHEGSRDPAPHSGGVLVLRRLTASLCLTGVCSKDRRAPVAGALCGCSPLFLLWGAFHSPGGATCRDNPEQAKTVPEAAPRQRSARYRVRLFDGVGGWSRSY